MKMNDKMNDEMNDEMKAERGQQEEEMIMDEKVLYQIRYVETADGFRVEATGDKDELRKMGFGPHSMMGFGRRVQHGRGPGSRRMRHMRARQNDEKFEAPQAQGEA
jgi:hypothetical protein